MTFDELLDATKRLLEHRKRLTYGALKRQFWVNDDFLEVLKAEIVQDPRVAVDEQGERLIWTEGPITIPRHNEQKEIDGSKLGRNRN